MFSEMIFTFLFAYSIFCITFAPKNNNTINKILTTMTKIFSKVLFLAVLMAGFCACKNNENAPEQKVDYDKMIGTWTLNSWSIKQVNTDDNIVEVDSTINKGTMTISKKNAGEDGTQYFYTENFLSINGGEYTGMILIENEMLNLCKEDGFNRQDMEYNFEYKVSFPA